MKLEKLLEKISLEEYRKFILLYSDKSPEFKTELEVYFADKDENTDLGKKYSEWIKKTIRKYENRGFITYKDSRSLAGDLQNIINTGFELVEKRNFLDAFELAKVALKETMEVITYCDDSSGSIGDTISFCIELLEQIAINPDTGIPLKEQLFFYLEKALKEDIYFDYGDFGYDLIPVFELLSVKLGQTKIFLKYIDNELSKPEQPHSDYKKNFYKVKKIEFLTSIERYDEAEKLITQNLDIVEVRQEVINKAIHSEDYIQAKTLIDDGIKIAIEKNHPGTVSSWHKELLRIAFLEKDVATIRHHSKYFAFDRGFNKEYYQIWKGTYLPHEWKEVIEVYIQETISFTTDIYEKNKKRGWTGQSMLALLSTVTSIYIEEKYLDRLLVLVKQEEELDYILFYHEVLLKDYPSELLEVYLPAIKVAAEQTSDRKKYKDFVKKLKKIIKDIPQGQEAILDIAKEMKKTYARRPAMVEELTKLIAETSA
ncbi:hypothetical protein [Pedobacter nutrimenti]|uniref:hypothetical protein n=1 Tax=Pedobacter nutrimenti TaxID=1241337 RepID=UPI00292F310D|nr:hypothetical protein [Pedobacter nutrimenti]